MSDGPKKNGVISFILDSAGHFQTVLQIKERITKHHGIPISKQTLVYNRKILPNDFIIADQSQIQLIIDDDSNHSIEFDRKIPLLFRLPSSKLIAIEIDASYTIKKLKGEIHEIEGVHPTQLVFRANGFELSDEKSIGDFNLPDNSEVTVSVRAVPVTSPSRRPKAAANRQISAAEDEFPKIKLLIKMPLPKEVMIEINQNDSVKKLKEKIHETEGVHPVRLVLHANGIELNDLKSIKECELSDNSKVLVSIRAVPIAADESAKMRVVVVPYDGKRIAVELNSSDTVGDLRKKLKNRGLDLPQEYFFIVNHAVMYDDHRSLMSHRVAHGDVIEIFEGYVA